MTFSAFLTALAVGTAGGAASVLRYGLDIRWPAGDVGSPLRRQPWGLWAANLLGSLIIGVASAGPHGLWATVLSAGAAGGLTTWSTWVVSAHRRWQEARAEKAESAVEAAKRSLARRAVLLQLLGQAAAGPVCVLLGQALGQALF